MSANFGLGLRTQEPQALHALGARIWGRIVLNYHAILRSGTKSNIRTGGRLDSAGNLSYVCEPVTAPGHLGGASSGEWLDLNIVLGGKSKGKQFT